jgi:signal peptidase I
VSAEPVPADAPAKTDSEPETWGSFARFVIKLVIGVAIFRSFFFTPFTIPSESMLPGLMNGDYLVAAKWPYGYSRWSLPWAAPLIPGKVFASDPHRGDVVIFKHPVDHVDYIKRAIALPGDTVAVRGGQVILNGTPVKRVRIDDFVLPMSANTGCTGAGRVVPAQGGQACVYMRWRETLPSGVSYDTLDFGHTPQDDFGPVVVPEGHVFMMGDNRDNSADSRFDQVSGGGVGLVPEELLVGRGSAVLWSTDGSASWLNPISWFTAARWGRIGDGV